MKEYEHNHRVLAASSYQHAKGNIGAALADFTTRCKELELQVPQDPRKFVKKWGQYWEKHKHVKGNASNSGRKPLLNKQQATTLVDNLLSWSKFDLKAPFQGVRQLRQVSPQARSILQAVEAARSTIIRAMKNIKPTLAYKKLSVKQKLTKKQREARVRVATHHITVSDKTLECVVWVDAKTMYMTISTRWGWVCTDEELPLEVNRPASKKNPITLKYYIGVCARAGAVFLTFYTGTTEMPANRDPRRVYLVSLGLVQLGFLASTCISHSPLYCRPPTLFTASTSARQQPQHMQLLLVGTCCHSLIPRTCLSQICAPAVATHIWLAVVLLPLHCNQQPCRL